MKMIKSMTGYGRSESVTGDRKYSVEIKSLNHRYLDVSLRTPSILSPFELEIKKKIGEQFSRGRIEVVIRTQFCNGQEAQGQYELNLPLIHNYHAMMQALKREFDLKDDITLQNILGLRDIFIQCEPCLDATVLPQELEEAIGGAMVSLKEMRSKEGENLCLDLTARIESIMQSLNAIADRAPQVVLEYQKRIIERIKEITAGAVVDEMRLNQEVAIMAERSDITEEIVRLSSHIHQFSELIRSDEAAGRKIDFLIQEMGREVNTIGSKSNDLSISRNIVEIKSELAKLREQAQNVE
jgi:uncharacterized protein (TIGR00255 family)